MTLLWAAINTNSVSPLRKASNLFIIFYHETSIFFRFLVFVQHRIRKKQTKKQENVLRSAAFQFTMILLGRLRMHFSLFYTRDAKNVHRLKDSYDEVKSTVPITTKSDGRRMCGLWNCWRIDLIGTHSMWAPCSARAFFSRPPYLITRDFENISVFRFFPTTDIKE